MTQELVDTATEGERVFAALAPEGAVPPWEAIADLSPALGAQVRQGLGAIMARPQLDLRTRELATVCMLAALGGCEPQLEFHVGGALRAGATPAEVVEAISQVYLYAGFPRALNALQVAKKVLADHGPTVAG
ncbi:carboxymuconolactone decarboxylase family protein [Actinophytocola sp.]|uniref:carboxymuconolactone decarboxylase family protein n=1 Tax=Actinophytocola sp. TaxID=1872138 RepID=UPI003899BFC8